MSKIKNRNVGPSNGNAQPKNAVSTTSPPQTTQQNPQQAHILPASPSGKGTQPHFPNHSGNPGNNKKHWLDHAIFWAAVVAAVAAMVAAGFTGWQSWITQDTAKRQLRAYVSIKEIEGDMTMVGPNMSPEQRLVAKNVGVSPAFNVEISAKMSILQYPLPQALDITPPLARPPKSNITIFPTNGHKSYATTYLSEEDFKEIMDPRGRKRLYTVAIVTYDDIYGHQHFTRYCSYIGGSFPSPIACDRYNETDDKKY